MIEFIKKMPKVELHLHIEGTFEPELMFEIAKRNNIKLKYNTVQELKEAYKFNNLQDFLNIYYEGANVLINEIDFYDLTYSYLLKCKEENIVHTEIFFDPQTHTDRGIEFEVIINGIFRALQKAKNDLGISSKLIMSFLRHLTENDAIKVFEKSLNFIDKIDGYGLDSSEKGNPPSKFKKVFEMARETGKKIVAHAGEEGPSEYIWEAINILKVDRIDHGNASINDIELIDFISSNNIALTVCPLSNLKLKVVKDLSNHPIKLMLDKNIVATINSDDPSYFGGYLTKNFIEIYKSLNLTKDEIIKLNKNSINSSFLNESEKQNIMNNFNSFINN